MLVVTMNARPPSHRSRSVAQMAHRLEEINAGQQVGSGTSCSQAHGTGGLVDERCASLAARRRSFARFQGCEELLGSNSVFETDKYYLLLWQQQHRKTRYYQMRNSALVHHIWR